MLAVTGGRLNGSPKHTASASVGYDIPLGNSYEVNLYGSINYVSERLTRALVPGGVAQERPGDDLLISRLNASLSSDAGWSVMLFVDNLTDESGIFTAAALPDSVSGNLVLKPRTIGLQLEGHF